MYNIYLIYIYIYMTKYKNTKHGKMKKQNSRIRKRF